MSTTSGSSGKAQKAVLTLILVAYLGLAFLYARSVPKWNAPDEPGHYNYAETIAQTWTFPILSIGDYDFDYLEKVKAAKFPDSLPVDRIRYESHQPPLYYMLAAPLLLVSSGLSIDAQVLILRLLSALFGALTIVVAFKVAQCVFPDDAILPLATAAFVAFLPMNLFMNAAIDNDSLANLLLSLLLFSLVQTLRPVAKEAVSGPGAMLMRHGEELETKVAQPGGSVMMFDRRSLIWGVLLGLGLLTKQTAYIGFALVALVILWQEVVSASFSKANEAATARAGLKAPDVSLAALRRTLWRLVPAFGIALLLSFWWFVRNAVVYGNLDILGRKRLDFVVVGQPLTGTFDLAAAKHFVVLSFQSFWGVFGWMGVFMDQRIYVVLALLSGCAVLGLLLYLWRVSRRPAELSPFQWTSLALLFLAFAIIVAGLVQYNLTYIQAQGRYLFPAIVPIAIFFNLGLRELITRRHAGTVFALLFLGLFSLDLLSLFRFILPQLR